jgi:hypothetical protein
MADVFRWGLTQNGQFTVKSVYSSLIMGNIWQNRFLWKLKVPLKIKIFLRYLNKGVTLTKDNLVMRNWIGSKNCVFCAHEENIQHLFFDYHYARFLWCMVFFAFVINEVIFDKSPTKSYMQVLYWKTYWFWEWVQLQPREDDMNDTRAACHLLETTIMKLFIYYGWRFSNRLGS